MIRLLETTEAKGRLRTAQIQRTRPIEGPDAREPAAFYCDLPCVSFEGAFQYEEFDQISIALQRADRDHVAFAVHTGRRHVVHPNANGGYRE